MGLPSVNFIYRVAFISRFREQNAVNVKRLRINAAVGFGFTEQMLADGLHTAYGTALAPAMSASASLVRVIVQQETLPPIPASVASVGDGIPGSVTGDPLPSQVAGVVKLGTDFGGREGRGRIYVPFAPESANDATGRPTAAHRSALQGVGNFFVGSKTLANAGDSVSFTWGLGRGGQINPLHWEFKKAIVRADWGTQRRRSHINKGDTAP